MVYLHEISEEEEVYIDQDFNGVLFFVDLLNTMKAEMTLLKWMDLYSKITGLNIFKIPLKVVVTKGSLLHHSMLTREKERIRSQLSKVIQPTQIIFWNS